MITAENMKEALESHSCLKGCRAAVVQVDTTKSVGVENKIPGISLLNNFVYEKGESVLGKLTKLVQVVSFRMTK